jgi:hypothetical protein
VRAGGGAGKTVVKDGGDVVGVTEAACCDEPRDEGVDVMVVGFGTPEFGGERAESVGVDRVFCFVLGEAGLRMRVAQRSCWAACAIVSYSAASCATDPHVSCSAVIVSCAESSAPTCCSTP